MNTKSESSPLVFSQPSKTRRYLVYVETFLSSFGERLWGFAVPIILATMYPRNMWPAASVALVETLGGFMSGPFVGEKIDNSSKIWLMQIALILQNVSIVTACAILFVMVRLGLSSTSSVPVSSWQFWVLLGGLVVATAVNSGAALARTVSMQKVWVPVTCEHEPDKLISTNAAIRRINLVCEIGAPLIFGLLLSFLPPENALNISIYFVVGWNLASFVPEIAILRAIYVRTPTLVRQTSAPKEKNSLRMALLGVELYVKHGVFLASFAYTLLFVTVLMPGVLMTTFLLSSGISQWQIAVFRGLCAVTGILATVIASPLMKKLGAVRAGVIFCWVQCGFLVPASFASFASCHGLAWAVYVFMAMVILSRMGLWGFDLAEVNIMQTCVEMSESGKINSVEYSATQLGSLLPYIAGILVNDPSWFPWLVLGSFVFTLGAGVIFSVWAQTRARLLGFPKTASDIQTVVAVSTNCTTIQQEETD